jgi:uncharacterized protein (DUF952 family)
MNPLPVNGPSAPVQASAKASPLLERLRLAGNRRSGLTRLYGGILGIDATISKYPAFSPIQLLSIAASGYNDVAPNGRHPRIAPRMDPIYHLVEPAAWEANPSADFVVASLESEGFIHCAFAHQVAPAANRFYPVAPALRVVQLDPARLTSPLRVELPSPTSTSAHKYPHVYGPLQRSAVVKVHVLTRDHGGRWFFPS